MKKLNVTRFPLSKLLRGALVLLLTVFMPVLLSGCHKARNLAVYEVPEDFDTSKHYEITFWSKNDTNNVQKRIYAQAIKDFEAAYPNITVTMRQYTDYGAIYNDVITNISTGTTPNVCISYPDHIATYLSGENIVVPLDAFFASEKYGFGGTDIKYTPVAKDGVVQKFLDEGRFDSCYYALPFMRSTEACYINKDMVEKLGYTIPEDLTWDFVFKVSEAAIEKDENGLFKINGQKVMIPFIYKSTDNMMIQMLKQKNAGYSDAAGNVYIFNDTTKELLNEIAIHAKSRAFSTFAISSYPGNYLNAGQCIFAIDSTAGATWLGYGAPLSDIHDSQKVKFETVVKPIPQFDPEHPQMISQGPSLCIFNKEDTGEVLASWLFAQYLLTDKVQAAYSQTEGYVPVTKSARESEQYKDYLSRSGEDNDTYYKVKIDATKLLLENTDNTFITPVFNGSASLRNAAGQLIEDVANAVRRKQTVDDEFYVKEKERIISLYKLNEITVSGEVRKELGELPNASKALIIVLIVVWAGIAAYFIRDKIREKRAQKQKH
jgi:multiple sugar transport system substrate-binding protein